MLQTMTLQDTVKELENEKCMVRESSKEII